MKNVNKKETHINGNDNVNIGLSIIPVSSEKISFNPWKQYQREIPLISSWHTHYMNQGTVGIITGEVSGNLECIDIDIKNDPYKTIMTEFTEIIPEELLLKLLIQSTPNNGFHLIYRCPDATIEKNLKLAKHSNGDIIIETRGEGGYFCTSKMNNEVIQGIFKLESLEFDIQIITKQEREILLEAARSLTRYFPDANNTNKKIGSKVQGINDFNNEYLPIELFEKHEWSVVKEDDEKYFLLRDGSVASHSGYYFKETRTFFCFSTSTEFVSEKPYNNFQILKLLEGKDDYKTTLRLLPDYGYPVNDIKSNKISSDDIANYLNDIGVKYDSFIQDLTLNGKIIEEREYNTLFIDLKKHFDKEIPRTKFEEIIKSNYINAVNPIIDFIEANKHRQPSGVFEQWLDCMVIKNDNIEKSTVLHFIKKWYVSMIAQALEGEYPNEFFLTLISVEQGIGKTTLLRKYILPKELHGYRKEHSLSFDDDFKVLMSQSLLIVDDEMDGRTYEEDKTFKTILSTKELTTRRKYDRRISTIKRRCSFAGSGNNLAVVREQQNRRILPLEIEKLHFEKLNKVDYVDLFMEAYNLYANGFQYSYQHSDKELLHQLYEDYVQKSDVDLILDEYLEQPFDKQSIFHITNLDIVTTLINKYPHFAKRINVPTIGKQMAERGFKTIRKGRKKTTYYEISSISKIVNEL